MKRLRLSACLGMTFIESVFLLLISSAVLATSAPLFWRSLHLSRLRAESHRVMSFFSETRLLALQSGSVVEVLLFEEGYSLSNAGAFHRYEFPDGFSLHFQAQKVVFYPTGAATPCSVQLQYRGESCRILISLYGRIRRVCT